TKLEIKAGKTVLSNTITLASIQDIRVFGGGGNDSLTINNLNKRMYFEGGLGTDTLNITGDTKINSTWNLAGGALNVNDSQATPGMRISYDASLENLVGNGQGKIDTFNVNAQPLVPTLLKGGTGNDVFNWNVPAAAGAVPISFDG